METWQAVLVWIGYTGICLWGSLMIAASLAMAGRMEGIDPETHEPTHPGRKG